MSWLLFFGLLLASPAHAEDWIRPSAPGAPLLWGRADGMVFGLPSDGGLPGPRGLIRVGIYNRQRGKPELINFIAVEPITHQSRKGFSEMEASTLDPGQSGKRLWVAGPAAGTLESARTLTVRIEVEPFDNGAHVYVIARMHRDRPGEVEFSVHHHDDSSAIDELTLSATMGNFERLRLLWLKDRVVDSRVLYAGAGFSPWDGFVDRENYPLQEMLRYRNGDALAAATTNEDDPSAVHVPEKEWWNYRSVKLTQYWRVPARDIQSDLRIKVNGRREYWGNEKITVPGGAAFENFEVRERYVPGQTFVFGLSRQNPRDLAK